MFEGQVRYARDAFEGLRLMDAAMAVKRGVPGARLPELRTRKVRTTAAARGPEHGTEAENPARSDISTDGPVPDVPFLGTEVIKGIPLADYAAYLDERALFMGQWGLKPTRGGPDRGAHVRGTGGNRGPARLRMWLERMQTEGLLEAAVVYGYFRCVSSGNDLIVLGPDGRPSSSGSASPGSAATGGCAWPTSSSRRAAVKGRNRRGCVPARHHGGAGVRGHRRAVRQERLPRVPRAAGLSVQLAEARAEYWHARVRRETGFSGSDPEDLDGFFRVGYRGARYLIGYPACPDLADRAKIVRLLEPSRIGVELSEEMQLHPEQSTDAIVVHHPEAKYFYASMATRGRRPASRCCSTWTGCSSTPSRFGCRPRRPSWPGSGTSGPPRTRLSCSAAAWTSRCATCWPRRGGPRSPELVAEWLMTGVTGRVRDHGVPVRPGARELLAEVAAAGLPRALVTGSQRGFMDAVLARTGMRFDALVCADDVSVTKPDPEPYLLAAKLLGADPARCYALEDSPNGVASAQAAGCQVIAAPSLIPIGPAPGRTVVRSLTELRATPEGIKSALPPGGEPQRWGASPRARAQITT